MVAARQDDYNAEAAWRTVFLGLRMLKAMTVRRERAATGWKE
jgi:hypothetical protein